MPEIGKVFLLVWVASGVVEIHEQPDIGTCLNIARQNINMACMIEREDPHIECSDNMETIFKPDDNKEK